MRLDRIDLRPLEGVLLAMVVEACQVEPEVVRLTIPTSPSDRVQVFLRKRGPTYYLAIRRPGGQEDPREIQALATVMGLVPRRIYPAKGRLRRPGFLGYRSYLVAECEVSHEQQSGVRAGASDVDWARLVQQQ